MSERIYAVIGIFITSIMVGTESQSIFWGTACFVGMVTIITAPK